MVVLRAFLLLLIFFIVDCRQPHRAKLVGPESSSYQFDSLKATDSTGLTGHEALLVTRFNSMDQLKSIVEITYAIDTVEYRDVGYKRNQVQLRYRSGNREVTSILKQGISQTDFMHAQNGTFRDKISLCIRCPYACMNRKDLQSIENLGRRYPAAFGVGDAAFLDLAEVMVTHITDEDLLSIHPKDLSEKGYLNTFNHITAQALMTSIFSESMADFIADVHELYNLPELATGKFTVAQMEDLEEGPVDNYIDMINNEWGQELGKLLSKKYSITPETIWTPELLADYLNDIQSYCSWALQIGFKPFTPDDYKVFRFSEKINKVLREGYDHKPLW